MKAAVLESDRNIQIREIEKPPVGDDEVRVRVRVTGICGSDIPRVLSKGVHFYPIILGHEFSGFIDEIGKSVMNVKKGDHVAGIPLIPCKKCIDCSSGNFSLCKNYSFIGSRQNGSMAQYVTVPASNVLKIDKDIPFETAAFFEPSTVALHGIKQAKYKDGKNVAVLGSGTIGLFTLQWLRILGAENIMVSDIDMEHLALAKEFKADHLLASSDNEFFEKADKITNGRGFDYVFVTTGAVPAMRSSFRIAGNKATICMIGTPTKDISFTAREWEDMNRKEFFLTGSWMSYSAPWPGVEWTKTAEHFKKGDLRVVPEMIFESFDLNKTMDAFNEYTIPGKVSGKIQIVDR